MSKQLQFAVSSLNYAKDSMTLSIYGMVSSQSTMASKERSQDQLMEIEWLELDANDLNMTIRSAIKMQKDLTTCAAIIFN